MSRPHPYDEIFAHVADEAFTRIRSEAGSVETMAEFARTPGASTFLEQVAPPGDAAPDPRVLGGYAHLVYCLYRFWQDGQVTRVVPRVDLDPADPPLSVPPPDVPTGVYLQFPEQWFWAQIEPDQPHEPLDGLFVAPSGTEIAVTAVLGFRPERMGFSQLTALADEPAFAAAPALARRPPFGPAMEGGAEAAFCSLVSEAELVHLTQLALDWGAE